MKILTRRSTAPAPGGGPVHSDRAPVVRRSPLFSWPEVTERFGLMLAWLIVVGIFGVLRPETFLTTTNFATIFGSQTVLVILTLGLLIPFTAGDFDISVASVAGLAAMIVAILNVSHGLPIGLAVAGALAAGVVCGSVNGIFVVGLRIDSIIATLGTGTFIAGVTLWISDTQTIGGISTALVRAVVITRFLGISMAFYYGIALCIVLWYVFEYTPLGRRLLFVGRGRNVARLSGVRVGRTRFGALIASATFAAGAGVVYAGTIGAADPRSASAFLLPAFAAAFLGATSITPGRFNPWGSLVAVYFLITGITGLQLLGAQNFVQQLFYGGALVFAVAISQVVRRRSEEASFLG